MYIWGLVYEKVIFYVKITIISNIYLSRQFCLIFFIMFKRILHFQKKAIKENYLAV